MKTYKFFDKEISGPFTIPSGIVATEAPILEKIANEIPEIGILTTKSIGLEERKGNMEPIIAQISPLSFINAVGLTNPGAKEFARRLSNIKIPDNKFLLTSIFGSSEQEFKEVAETLYDHADGFELNISCPHSDKYGQTVGQDINLVTEIIRSVSSLKKPVLAKISPNLDIEKTVKFSISSGISGFTAINTKGPKEHLYKEYPILSNKVGGVSGKAILETGIEAIKTIRKITDLPIIACGGISTAEDLKKYQSAGADFFGIGSALAGMDTAELKDYFSNLSADFENGTNNAERFLKPELKMEYEKFTVRENRQLSEGLFRLVFDKGIKVEPGQFIFTWLPGKGEKPFSALDDSPLTLLVRKIGCFTRELANLKKGDCLFVRGPYGKSPEVGGKILLVGGGTGVTPLYLFTKRNQNTYVMIGAKNRQDLHYEIFKEPVLYTENGEIGEKGYVTDGLEKAMEKIKPDYCINCGPRSMVETAIQKESKYLNPEKIYSSIELLTKCGIGLCGSCTTKTGYRSCVDGTFLQPEKIF